VFAYLFQKQASLIVSHTFATLSFVDGVGYGKIKYLKQQYGPGAVHMMKLIKNAIDPQNIMNPGKVVER
jgi:FAD/FMN-containing dehydrogenase